VEQFKKDSKGTLICPWCPPTRVTILIKDCRHNPFALMRRVKDLEDEVDHYQRGNRLLQDLKDYFQS